MATLASIYKDLKHQAAMFDSYRSLINEATKTVQFIEKFRRDNQLVAEFYHDTIRKYLAERGWYVGASLTARQIVTLARGIKKGGYDSDIETFMVEHVRSELNNIHRSACDAWPRREAILNDAFEAHRNDQYTLSIPTLLSQADGMAFDILDAFAFTNHSVNIANNAQEFIESKIADRCIMSSYVGILLEDSGMRVSTTKRDEKRDADDPVSPVNRHGVMHGIDSDYPNEANSLRVISLIGLLATIHDLKASDEDA